MEKTMRAIVTIVPVLASVLALAACEDKAAEQVETVPAAAAELAGVKLDQSLRALGNEPFWSVQIEEDKLTYKPLEGELTIVDSAGPEITGNMAVWTGTDAKGTTLKVTLTGADCSDGMSDRTYSLTAQVQLGDVTLNGCAASTQALQYAGESGRVQ